MNKIISVQQTVLTTANTVLPQRKASNGTYWQ